MDTYPVKVENRLLFTTVFIWFISSVHVLVTSDCVSVLRWCGNGGGSWVHFGSNLSCMSAWKYNVSVNDRDIDALPFLCVSLCFGDLLHMVRLRRMVVMTHEG